VWDEELKGREAESDAARGWFEINVVELARLPGTRNPVARVIR
jgi:hypothetical protein